MRILLKNVAWGLICAFYHIKISDTRTIKKRWLRDLFSHVRNLRRQKLYKDQPRIDHHKILIEGSCAHARYTMHTKISDE